MDSMELSDLLEGIGAIITGSHIVYAAGDHGDAYINKDVLYTNPGNVELVCEEIADRIYSQLGREGGVAIVSPAIGGVALSQWTTSKLQRYFPSKNADIVALYADKKDGGGFVLKRGYEKMVAGKKTYVVEDILNSGGSALDTVKAVRDAGGEVAGVFAICNRGGVTAEMLGVPHLETLMNVSLAKYPEAECPLCKAGVPINVSVGHGKQFLERGHALRHNS